MNDGHLTPTLLAYYTTACSRRQLPWLKNIAQTKDAHHGFIFSNVTCKKIDLHVKQMERSFSCHGQQGKKSSLVERDGEICSLVAVIRAMFALSLFCWR